MRFGISTHLFHGQRLGREHLAQVAVRGFETIELFATRSHFDYRDESAVGHLKGWLSDTGLTLNSVHAPIMEQFGGSDTGAPTYSTALADRAGRERTIREIEAALRISERIPFDVLVVHLGTPAGRDGAGDNDRAAAVQSVQELCDLAAPLGVRVAVEVIPNRLSHTDALVNMLEQHIEARHAGICLDFGHAHLLGDVPDAVETAAEHIIATHVHDNHGRQDEHLAPGLGTIDWAAALITMQKIGYAGPFMMELADTGSPDAVLEGACRARERFERAQAYP